MTTQQSTAQINNRHQHHQRHHRMLIIGLLLTLIVFAITTNVMAPLATSMARDVGVRYELFGMVFAIQFLCFSIACFIAGWLLKRLRIPDHTLVLISLGAVAATLILGSAIHSFWQVILWVIPLGFFGGLIETVSSLMISNEDEPGSSKLLNLSQVFFCLGAISAPQLASITLGHGLSWKVTLILLGVLSLLLAVVFKLLTWPQYHHPTNAAARRKADQAAGVELITMTPQVSITVIMSLFLFLYVATEGGMAYWTPTYFELYLGTPVDAAAWRLSVFWTGIICGRGLMLVLPTRWTLWPAIMTGAVGLVICTTIMSMMPSAVAATVVLFAVGLCAGPLWPITVSLTQQLNQSNSHTAVVIGSGSMGLVIGPFVTAYIIKQMGLAVLFKMMMVSSIGLVAVIMAARLISRAKQQQS